MRKVSKIFLLVGGISAIICAFTFFVCAIVFFVGLNPALLDAIKDALIQAGNPDPDVVITFIKVYSVLCGVFFIIFAALCVPSAVIAFKAQKAEKPSKGLLIANIILGYLSCSFYNFVGAIVGLIQNAREDRKDKKAQIADAQ